MHYTILFVVLQQSNKLQPCTKLCMYVAGIFLKTEHCDAGSSYIWVNGTFATWIQK
jgi:hypothetical protein